MKAFKVLLATVIWTLLGTMSMKGAVMTHGMMAWQSGLVLAIILVFIAISVVAIARPQWIPKQAPA